MSDRHVPGEDVPLPVPIALTALGFAAALGAASMWTAPAVASEAPPPPVVSAVVAAPPPEPAPAPPSAQPDAGPRACRRLVIVFTYAGAQPPPNASPALTRLATWLGTHADATAVLDGHADALGNDRGNLELSKRRANAVAKFLVDGGVARERLTVRGFGAFSPLEGEKEDAAQNRRVVVAVRGATECPVFEEEVIGP